MIGPAKPVRLVVLDLDGTTLNKSHELSTATIEAIHAVTARGIRVVLASGRLPHSIRPFAQRLGLDNLHFGLNGGVSFDLEGTLYHQHTMSVGQLDFAHRVLAAEGLGALVFGSGGLWAPGVSTDAEFIMSFGEPEPRVYSIDRLDAIEDPIKVLTVLDSGPRDLDLAAMVSPQLQAIRTGPKFFEFMAPGVSKGAALSEYLADLGLDPSEVMAVGDSENDASMLTTAGFAVAMGNAVPAVKAIAHAITATNADDGVALALHRWILDFDGQ